MKKKFSVGLGVLGLILISGVLFSDEVESLIDDQKAEVETWKGGDEDLPPTFLSGHESLIEIYSSAADHKDRDLLCHSVEFDRLLDFSAFDENGRLAFLDPVTPQIRNALTEFCLVRPQDEIMAIGPGQQQKVSVAQFFIKSEKPLCPNDPPFSLNVSYEDALSFEPLFFSTDADLKEGPNQFLFFSQLSVSTSTLSVEAQKDLIKQVPFLDEYKEKVYVVNQKNCDNIIILEREQIKEEDAGFPHKIILWEKDGQVGEMVSERIDLKNGSGHVAIQGILDYNGDGVVDVLVEGDHAGCLYRMFFEGIETGFQRVDFPSKPCSC